MPTGSTYDFSLDPLFAAVAVSQSKSSIVSTKIELILKKSVPGQRWPSLEGDGPVLDENSEDPNKDHSTLNGSSAETSKKGVIVGVSSREHLDIPPAYPTSSKTGPKNWDKLAAELTKKPKTKPQSKKTAPANPQSQSTPSKTLNKDSDGQGHTDDIIEQEQDREPGISSPKKNGTMEEKQQEAGEGEMEEEGEEGEEEEESDQVHGFFKKLYAGADPDTRRAMMKSYQESNGTALSTNWAEVGKGPVETSPPDGMVAKKWGE